MFTCHFGISYPYPLPLSSVHVDSINQLTFTPDTDEDHHEHSVHASKKPSWDELYQEFQRPGYL